MVIFINHYGTRDGGLGTRDLVYIEAKSRVSSLRPANFWFDRRGFWSSPVPSPKSQVPSFSAMTFLASQWYTARRASRRVSMGPARHPLVRSDDGDHRSHHRGDGPADGPQAGRPGERDRPADTTVCASGVCRSATRLRAVPSRRVHLAGGDPAHLPRRPDVSRGDRRRVCDPVGGIAAPWAPIVEPRPYHPLGRAPPQYFSAPPPPHA